MLKVNETKMLQDYNDLLVKREENLTKIEMDARSYATSHGYNEEKTLKFIEFTQELEGNGLDCFENQKLQILQLYIENVEENNIPDKLSDADQSNNSQQEVNSVFNM